MILLSELSRRRIRSIQKLIRVGRNEVVVVLRVDREKGARVLSLLRLFFAPMLFWGVQGISTFQSVVFPQKTLPSAKKNT